MNRVRVWCTWAELTTARPYDWQSLTATEASTDRLAVLTNLLELLDMPAELGQLVPATDPMIIVNRLTRQRSSSDGTGA